MSSDNNISSALQAILDRLAQNVNRLLSRIRDDDTAFAAIKAAIGRQNITVPDDAEYDDYADYIDTIEGPSELPQLNKLSLARSNDTVTISNPSLNGGFATAFKLYNGSTVINQNASSSFSLKGLGAGSYELTATAIGTNFRESEPSNKIKAKVCTITKSLTDLTGNNNDTLIASGLPYTITLTPVTGKYLPEDIVVTMDGQPCKYTYNSYTGEINIKSVTGNIAITAVAYNAPKLRRPVLALSGSQLEVTPPLYAEVTKTYIDDELVYTYNNS